MAITPLSKVTGYTPVGEESKVSQPVAPVGSSPTSPTGEAPSSQSGFAPVQSAQQQDLSAELPISASNLTPQTQEPVSFEIGDLAETLVEKGAEAKSQPVIGGKLDSGRPGPTSQELNASVSPTGGPTPAEAPSGLVTLGSTPSATGGPPKLDQYKSVLSPLVAPPKPGVDVPTGIGQTNINGTTYTSVLGKMSGAPQYASAGTGGTAAARGFVSPVDSPDVLPEVLQRFEGQRLPASLRLNNMGGISITGSEKGIPNSWAARQPGFVGVVKRPANEGGWYAQYATPTDGVRAASNLLVRYGEQGVNTTAKIANRWAEGGLPAYIATTTRYLNEAGFNVTKDTPLDLNNPQVRLAIVKAKSAHESGAGRPIYTDNVFTNAIGGN